MKITTAIVQSLREGRLGRHRVLWTVLLLACAAWVRYLPSVEYDFVHFDDVRILRDHPELYGQPRLSDNFRSIFKTSFPREEPLLLRDVSWVLDSRVFGFGNPRGYHMGNVFLHGVVVGLMCLFLLGTTRRYGFALAVSVFYLALAIHTEPVAWIMGRKDILSAIFMLLALCAQTRRLRESGARAGAWYCITIVCFGCGLLSKINVLTFPLVLFLHAVLYPYLNGTLPPNAPLRGNCKWGRETLLLVPALVLSGVVYLWYSRTLAQMGILERGYTARGLAHLWNLLIIDPVVIWIYLRQAFFPSELKVLYAWPQMTGSYPVWLVAGSLGTLFAAAAAALWLVRRHKDLFFYYGAFVVLMLPYLNLIFMGILVADRYLYFAVFCLLALAVSFGARVMRHGRSIARAVILALAAVSLLFNLVQGALYQPVWRNSETLWQYHVALRHPVPMAYANLAAGYYADAVAQNAPANVETLLKKMAVVVDAGLTQFWPDRRQPPSPDLYFLFFLKSVVLETSGEWEGALSNLLISDRLHPDFSATQQNLAHLYRKLARKTDDPRQRQEYACAAFERYARYISLTYGQRMPTPEEQKQLTEFEAECPIHP